MVEVSVGKSSVLSFSWLSPLMMDWRSRSAAFPVGARSRQSLGVVKCPNSRRRLSIFTTVVVFPVPGPPEMMVRRFLRALIAALAWSFPSMV